MSSTSCDKTIKAVTNMSDHRLLSRSFSPSSNEVIIGRGRKVAKHSGNERLLDLVHSQLYAYSSATSKTTKSAVLLRVVNQVRQGSSVGGFVKLDPSTKRWYAVDEACARTTTAQAFRDSLSHTYKSSKRSKQQRRWQSKPLSSSFHGSSVSDSTIRETFFTASNQTPFCTAPSEQVGPANLVPTTLYSRVLPQARASHGTGARVTDAQALMNILDSALEIAGESDPFHDGSAWGTAPTVSMPTFASSAGDDFWPPMAPRESNSESLDELLNRFANVVEWTENPFEPTPLFPPPNTTAPADLGAVLQIHQNHHSRMPTFKQEKYASASGWSLVDAMIMDDFEPLQ